MKGTKLKIYKYTEKDLDFISWERIDKFCRKTIPRCCFLSK